MHNLFHLRQDKRFLAHNNALFAYSTSPQYKSRTRLLVALPVISLYDFVLRSLASARFRLEFGKKGARFI